MKKFSFLSFAMVIVGFCMCVSCGYLISTMLVSTGLFSTYSVNFEAQTVYAISMMSSQEKTEIESQKVLLQAQNGAGYIYEKDECFYLLASIYENKTDAELVKNNLASQGVDCEILEIQISANSVDGDFSADEKEVLSECLKANFEIFKKLYDVSVSLDTEVFDKVKAKLECNTIYSSLISTRTNFETLFSDDDLSDIADNLENIEEQLSNLISENVENESQTFSSLIKLTYCKILLE